MRLLPMGAALLLLGGCTMFTLDFSRKVSEEELILQEGIRTYYDTVGAAFAVGNADSLADLYDDGITRPMTKDQIRAWGRDFFAKHGPARFKVEKIDFERTGHVTAVVELTYRVETRDGDGSFRGVERDELVQRARRWYVTAWKKIPEPPKP